MRPACLENLFPDPEPGPPLPMLLTSEYIQKVFSHSHEHSIARILNTPFEARIVEETGAGPSSVVSEHEAFFLKNACLKVTLVGREIFMVIDNTASRGSWVSEGRRTRICTAKGEVQRHFLQFSEEICQKEQRTERRPGRFSILLVNSRVQKNN